MTTSSQEGLGQSKPLSLRDQVNSVPADQRLDFINGQLRARNETIAETFDQGPWFRKTVREVKQLGAMRDRMLNKKGGR